VTQKYLTIKSSTRFERSAQQRKRNAEAKNFTTVYENLKLELEMARLTENNEEDEQMSHLIPEEAHSGFDAEDGEENNMDDYYMSSYLETTDNNDEGEDFDD
jgi:hypothetical protein